VKNIRVNVAILISMWLLVLLPGVKSQAAGTYAVSFNEENKMITSYNETQITNTYLSLVGSGTEYKVVKPGTKKSEIYYFDNDGFGDVYSGTGYVKISYDGKNKEYYAKKGVLQKDKIVGSKKQGYAYVDSTGIRIKDKTVQYAVKYVVAHTKSSDKKSVKLRKCYTYLHTHYPYKRYYDGLYPTAKDMSKMGQQMFKEKKGNCHRYAICFAYIARVLGYDSKVVVGDTGRIGGGWTPHGWALIKNGKNWYVCDPDMELHNVDAYMKSVSPVRTKVTRTCKLTIKNGKVVWK